MAYEQRTNSGSLFKNDKKETEHHPDYNGTVNVEGVSYWLSAWIKTAASGQKYMSLALKPKDSSGVAPKAPQPTHSDTPFNDEIPF